MLLNIPVYFNWQFIWIPLVKAGPAELMNQWFDIAHSVHSCWYRLKQNGTENYYNAGVLSFTIILSDSQATGKRRTKTSRLRDVVRLGDKFHNFLMESNSMIISRVGGATSSAYIFSSHFANIIISGLDYQIPSPLYRYCHIYKCQICKWLKTPSLQSND